MLWQKSPPWSDRISIYICTYTFFTVSKILIIGGQDSVDRSTKSEILDLRESEDYLCPDWRDFPILSQLIGIGYELN